MAARPLGCTGGAVSTHLRQIDCDPVQRSCITHELKRGLTALMPANEVNDAAESLMGRRVRLHADTVTCGRAGDATKEGDPALQGR
jgi:hypothetical protein